MTIKYCDYINGNDDTGDGTRTNPYKTITKSSTGLTGGDEVRCAKSSDPTDLSGTLTWTNNNVSVATSVDLTGVLAAKDFIRKKVLNAADYDVWWEISSINASNIYLVATFRGYSEPGSVGQKLGVTSTGAAASSTTAVQTVSVSGISDASRLVISGGWDLSQNPAVRTGMTWFFQSGTNLYGYGIYSNNRSYITFEYLGGLRYNYFVGNSGWLINFNYVFCAGCVIGLNGFQRSIIDHYAANNPNASGKGLWLYGDSVIKNAVFVNNAIAHIYGYTGGGHYFVENCVFAGTGSTYALYAQNCVVEMINCNFQNENIYIVAAECYLYNPLNLSLSDITFATTVSEVFSCEYHAGDVVNIKNWNGEEYSISCGGYSNRDTDNARSGACVSITPTSTSLYHVLKFMFPADANTARTLKFYAKKSIDFDGSVDAAIWFCGTKITDWTSLNLTTNYAQYSIVADVDDTPMSGVYVLRIRVKKGTAGSVYIDDLSFS